MALWRTPLIIVVKVAITLSLLWWLVSKYGSGEILERLVRFSPAAILLSIALTFAGNILIVLRWGILTRKLGILIRRATLIRYGLIGFFFSQVLPSSFGGDGVRLWLLYRDGVGASLAIRSVFIDRLAGLLTLALLCLYGLAHLLQPLFGLNPRLLTTGLVLALSLGIAFTVLVTRSSPWLNRYRLGRLFIQLVYDLRLLVRMKGTLATITALSIAGQLLPCFIVWILLRDMHESVSPVTILTVTPVIFILLIFPISIAGWGLREGLFIAVLGQIGIAQDVALVSSVVFGLINLLASLVGGAIWISGANRNNKKKSWYHIDNPSRHTQDYSVSNYACKNVQSRTSLSAIEEFVYCRTDKPDIVFF